ncbi:MAG TPA: shikimate dehydrogenase [Baekduia sp.]|uniref:shikimate dehydrogenase family protein n=1 Tax=Baekduia sp. TaxID=2600305 RepID=UPI002C1D49E2|nr:shikimate dehydrogenase [Baekduia sp.]HMJ37716.1 shikimate dehydrogenase [Baekduia sp.]
MTPDPTRRVALIGRPLRRRHSQVMHDAAFAANGIDARYDLREIEAGEVADFVAQARGPEWLGFQITAPYKRDVMALLDAVEPEAEAIGAVNSVLRAPDGTLVGFNTDAPGFAAAVRRDLGMELGGARVVVAGAGGAAHAVAHAAVSAGAAEVRVVSRTLEPAQALADRVGGVVAGRLDDRALPGALAAADLLVNATTVGMLTPGVVVDPALLGEHAAVFDLVYVPLETELLRAARERGLRAAGGAGMVVAQAVIAFGRWTGVADVTDVMQEAVAPLLEGAAAP